MFFVLSWLFVTGILLWAASEIAKSKNRSVAGWVVTTLFFGIFALILLAILPKKELN